MIVRKAASAALCTIVAKNYLAYARTLAESFYAQHPDGQMFVLLVDRPDGYFDPQAEPFTVLVAEDLPIPHFAQMAFRYSVLELSTAVKPFLLEYLIEHYQLDQLIYLDPDIYCYQPLTPLLEALQTHFIALTPHILAPIDADLQSPNELHILQAGIYNLGCIGIARHPQLASFLHWWQQRLERNCVVDIARGLFVDQRWIDFVPALYKDVAIVRDPGCNVAYWNLSNRSITAGNPAQGLLVNDSPLTFYHFSGLPLDSLDRISVHQDRYTLSDLPLLQPLFLNYRERLIEQGAAVTRRWPYSYTSFSNQVAIPEFARAIWRNNDGERRWPQPFKAHGTKSFFAWLNEEAHPSEEGGLLTHLALEIYQHRLDVRIAFPDIGTVHRRAFLNWFVHDIVWQHQIDQAFIRPIRQSLVALDTVTSESQVYPSVQNSTAPRAALPALPAPRAAHLPEAPLIGAPTMARKLYYALRNPLRRLGLHEQLKRLIGREQAIHIYKLMVLGSASSAVVLPLPALPQVLDPTTKPVPHYTQGLNVIGYLKHPTGVGEVARAILRSVGNHRYPTSAIDLQQHATAGLDATAWKYQHNLLCVNADALPAVRQALGAQFFKERPTIGFWHWETSHFPQEWHDRFSMVDELWVASDFVQQALALIAPIPVLTMPVPVMTPPAPASPAIGFNLPAGRFIWLFTFDMHSVVARKNPLAVIAAFRKAFGAHSQQAHLIIKANHTEEYPSAAAELRSQLASVGGTLIDYTMDRDQLGALFARCDGYISLHRSEGFGLTMAEAMALGKPVVATGYSGNLQFMTEQNSFLVRHTLVEIERAYGPYPAGHVWAEPDTDHAAELMIHVLRNPEDAAQRARLAAQDIRRRFAPEVVAQSIIARLGKVVCAPAQGHND